MLVMPLIFTMLMFMCVVFIIMGMNGMNDFHNFRDGVYFYNAIEQVDSMKDTLSDTNLQNIQLEVEELNKTYVEHSLTLAIYKGEKLIYPSSVEEISNIQISFSEEDDYLIVKGSNAVYKTHKGEFSLILSSTDFSLHQQDPSGNYFYIGIFIFIFSVTMVFIINRTLTRFVSKRITTPIERLVSGVHELQDGNLDFRIQYDYNDEFKSVCTDFNKMAQHLSDMVTARQKDEESRKELIAGISHDLRTPLTSIKAYVEGLEKGVASTPQSQKRYIETIKSKAEDLEHIINQLFLFSKLEIGEFPLKTERVEIGEVLSGFLYEVENEYENKGLSIAFVENSNKLYIEIDIVQFRNVLYNIFENSVKYKTNHMVNSKITCDENNDNIVISITDDGPGVQDDTIDKLFDVFYRSDVSRKNPSSGSGLGLAIARKTIERLGGAIRAENAPSGGLAIIITLPKSGGRA